MHFILSASYQPQRNAPCPTATISSATYIYRNAVEKEIEEMIKEGVIEPANSEWASPMVIIHKKDDTIRLCVDYRRLNAVTHRNAYPMPRMEEILDQVGQAKYIATLDLAKGYWQVPVAVRR